MNLPSERLRPETRFRPSAILLSPAVISASASSTLDTEAVARFSLGMNCPSVTISSMPSCTGGSRTASSAPASCCWTVSSVRIASDGWAYSPCWLASIMAVASKSGFLVITFLFFKVHKRKCGERIFLCDPHCLLLQGALPRQRSCWRHYLPIASNGGRKVQPSVQSLASSFTAPM